MITNEEQRIRQTNIEKAFGIEPKASAPALVLHLKLPPELYASLKALAAADQRTLHNYLTLQLLAVVKRRQPKPRAAEGAKEQP